MVQGKFVIIAMVTVGLGLSGFAWWARYQGSRQVLSVWGPDAVIAIRQGREVELLRLSDEATDEPATETMKIHDREVFVQSRKDITQVPGLIHARHHLIHEKGFDWTEPRPDTCEPTWDVAIRFRLDERVATLAMDFQCNRAFLVERDAEVSMKPISASMQKFLDGIPAGQINSGTQGDVSDQPNLLNAN